ncbi:Complement C1q subcomponent subunit B [Mactra antiquata]
MYGIKPFLFCLLFLFWYVETTLPADAGWSDWSDWGPCSVTCDVGLKKRYRECNVGDQETRHLCYGDTSEYDICKMKPCAGNVVAFSATGVIAVAENAGPISFPNVLQNFGNGYDPKSGNFTCSVPGIYHFAFSVTKLYRDVIFTIKCSLQINGINKVGTYRYAADLSDYGDGFGIGTSLTHHLDINDTVSVGDCDNISTMDNSSYSSFNGFLIAPDQ